MRNRIVLGIEVFFTIVFLVFFLIHATTGRMEWNQIIIPLVCLGIMRLFAMILLAIYSINKIYYWIRWKITGKQKVKIKVKRKRKKGQ